MLDQLINWRVALVHHLIHFMCRLRLCVPGFFASTALFTLVSLLLLFHLRSTAALDLDAIDAERFDRLRVRCHSDNALILWDRQSLLFLFIISVLSHANWVDELRRLDWTAHLIVLLLRFIEQLQRCELLLRRW